MPSYLKLGQSRNDIALSVDFYRKRAIVRTNTNLVEGIPLEDIPTVQSGHAPGMVLICRSWKNLYFLKEREDWVEDDYFKAAIQHLVAMKIKNP